MYAKGNHSFSENGINCGFDFGDWKQPFIFTKQQIWDLIFY